MQKNSVLVTGASGFLGSALVALLSQNRPVKAAIHRTKPPILLPGVEYIQSELSAAFDWSGALTGISVVVHCAARVHQLRDDSPNPIVDFRAVNVDGTLHLARQAALMKVKRFIFVSSIGVNGNQTFDKPFSEEDVPSPQADYAISKLEAELGLREIARLTGMEIVVIRPPAVYGPDAPGNLGLLMRSLRAGIPLPLGTIVKNRRSFIFLENLVEFIRLCIDHPAAAGQIFVVSDGEDLSTAILVRNLAAAMGVPARLFPVPVTFLKWCAGLLGHSATARSLCDSLQVDSSKARYVLGWTPPVSVEEALSRMAACFNSHIQ